MSAENPISPKAIAGSIAAFVAPFVLVAVSYLVEWIASEEGKLWIESLPGLVQVLVLGLAAGVGAAIAAYKARDGLRLPTIDQAEVEKLPDPKPTVG